MALSKINRFAAVLSSTLCVATPVAAQIYGCIQFVPSGANGVLTLCPQTGQTLDVSSPVMTYLQDRAAIQLEQSNARAKCDANPACEAHAAIDHPLPPPPPEALTFLGRFGITAEMVR